MTADQRANAETHIRWLKESLESRKAWTKADYAEFYERDIAVLLPLASAYLALTAALPAFVRRCVEAGAVLGMRSTEVNETDGEWVANIDSITDILVAKFAAELAVGK